MDKNLFNSNFLGEKVELGLQKSDTEFVFSLSALSMEWEIPNHVWPLLNKAHIALARMDGAMRFADLYTLYKRPLFFREIISSLNLERSLNVSLELFDTDFTEAIYDFIHFDSDYLSTNLLSFVDKLRSLNLTFGDGRLFDSFAKDLNMEFFPGRKDSRRYRDFLINSTVNPDFIPAPPEIIEGCMSELSKFLNEVDESVDPLLISFMTLYQFEVLHPFFRGNGIIGRILTSSLIFKTCDLREPIFFLSTYFNKHKEKYNKCLFEANTKGRWDNWITFCIEGVIWQANDVLNRNKNLSRLKKLYKERAMQVPGNKKVLFQSIDLLFLIDSFFTITQFSKRLGVSYPTAKTHLDTLIELDIVVKKKKKSKDKSTFFAVPDILEISFLDLFDT